MKTAALRPFPFLVIVVVTLSLSVSAQSATLGKTQAIVPSTSSQGTSTPVPDPALQFSLWQQSSQSTTASADFDTQFKSWQAQRTSADSINFFKCTTSTDLDNPECVGKLPGTKVTGTKEATTPITFPLRKSKSGEPD